MIRESQQGKFSGGGLPGRNAFELFISSPAGDARTTSTPQILLAICLFALAAHLLFIGLLPSRWGRNQNNDYFHFYEPTARNLANGKGLITSDGRPAVLYPPRYPLILAGLFKTAQSTGLAEAWVQRAFTALTVMLTAVLVYGIGATIFGRSVGYLAAVAWSTYPFYLWLTKQPNSEIPFLVFLPSISSCVL